MLMFIICQLLNIYDGYLGVHLSESPLSMLAQMFHSVLWLYFSTAYQTLLLRATHSFLYLTNVSVKHSYVYFHCSILLYTFVVFQVEHVWRLLSTLCTVKPHKPLVSLWFHCQWNHWNCAASIPTVSFSSVGISNIQRLVFFQMPNPRLTQSSTRSVCWRR